MRRPATKAKKHKTTRKSFLIVGGKGRMGQLFAHALRKRGHKVQIADKGFRISAEVLRPFDIVVISVPMEIACSYAAKLGPLMPRTSLLCDLNSLKQKICAEYKKSCRSEALGLHPMFGPTVSTFQSQKIVFCPVKSGALSRWFIAELKRMGFSLRQATPELHDRMTAFIQVLVHFNKFVVGQVLAQSKIPIKDTLDFTSPIYKLELAVIGRMFAQDPKLYVEIQRQNPWGNKIRDDFIAAAKTYRRLLKARTSREALAHVSNTRIYFKDFSETALKLSDRIILESMGWGKLQKKTRR